ncbi:MAG: prolyl oligopeptidase family serine peptidase [Akkermansiaceae bacterium]|nr:prolyl oligopeptidase family serine peptidase [Akkermansiaceae bacterium]
MNSTLAASLLFFGFSLGSAFSIDVRAEMRRAADFGKVAPSLVVGNILRGYRSSNDCYFLYRLNTGKDEERYFKVDTRTGEKSSAFDHGTLAKLLSKSTGKAVDGKDLPIEQLALSADGQSLSFDAFQKSWVFTTASQELSSVEKQPQDLKLVDPESVSRGTIRNGPATSLTIQNGTPSPIQLFWIDGEGDRKPYGMVPAGESATQATYSGHVWMVADEKGTPLAGMEAVDAAAVAKVHGPVNAPLDSARNISPDGKWRALIVNHNLVLEPTASGISVTLSSDGNEADAFTQPIFWAPDSQKVVAFRVKKVVTRQIHIVESSPPDQVQPRLKNIDYAKAGDPIAQPMPHLFDLPHGREIPLDHNLFDNPWEISEPAWTQDSSEFSFVYNQRGHQVMRIVGVRADSGSVRSIFEDRTNTFIDYSQKFFIHRLPDTREILWASERSGYNHLYLIDEVSGKIKNAVTQGSWNVRKVVSVDDLNRTLLIKMVGVAGQDPYHTHVARVNFDGSGFTRLTVGDGDHQVDFSTNEKFIIDTWSRVDQPPVTELRRAVDGKLICELSRADDSALRQTGWSRPERFVSMGRDGKTEIHGIIMRPTTFNPQKKYPVLEYIYAGPHDFFVPKSYFAWSRRNPMAELGFVIVCIDGMGTNWRSKAFHDVCWKNLSDSGFPDRIPWIQAAAATRPWMDLTRVGIYGGSAGGQSTLAGLLHHGDFYQVGVSDCGCHDNRMDKIWWNEAWMGWPVDESYERNSNVTHVAKLTGKLMLFVGEVDTNVDPASTAQVVNALQKADKDFEFVPVMNANHGAAETPYGQRRRAEFLVRELLR